MAAITAGMVTARPDPALEVRSEEWAEDASTLAASEVVSRDFENQLIIGFSKLTDASDFVACSTEFQMKLSYM